MARSGRVLPSNESSGAKYVVLPGDAAWDGTNVQPQQRYGMSTKSWILWTLVTLFLIFACGLIASLTSQHEGLMAVDSEGPQRQTADLGVHGSFDTLGGDPNDPNKKIVRFDFEKGQDSKPPPSIGYLGSGYDIHLGNPEGGLDGKPDAGFRRTVAILNYTTSRPCPNMPGHLCPKYGAHVAQVLTCDIPEHAELMSTMTKYTELLDRDARIDTMASSSGAMVSATAFQASQGYIDMRLQVEGEFQKVRPLCRALIL